METSNKKKKVRMLKDVHFDFDGAHVALTSNGAASFADEPYLLKSLEVSNTESESLLTQAQDNTSASDEAENVSKSQPENKEDLMDQEAMKALQDQVEALQKQLADKDTEVAIDKAAVVFGKYELEAELVKELSEAFHTEHKELVVKALDAMVVAKDAAVEKSKEVKDEEANDLAKALEAEAGHTEKHEADKPATMFDRVQKAKQPK